MWCSLVGQSGLYCELFEGRSAGRRRLGIHGAARSAHSSSPHQWAIADASTNLSPDGVAHPSLSATGRSSNGGHPPTERVACYTGDDGRRGVIGSDSAPGAARSFEMTCDPFGRRGS